MVSPMVDTVFEIGRWPINISGPDPVVKGAGWNVSKLERNVRLLNGNRPMPVKWLTCMTKPIPLRPALGVQLVFVIESYPFGDVLDGVLELLPVEAGLLWHGEW